MRMKWAPMRAAAIAIAFAGAIPWTGWARAAESPNALAPVSLVRMMDREYAQFRRANIRIMALIARMERVMKNAGHPFQVGVNGSRWEALRAGRMVAVSGRAYRSQQRYMEDWTILTDDAARETANAQGTAFVVREIHTGPPYLTMVQETIAGIRLFEARQAQFEAALRQLAEHIGA